MAAPPVIVNTQTVPNNAGSTVTSPLTQLRTVTYILRAFQLKLEIPYAVEVNGVIADTFSAKPKQVFCAPNDNSAPVGGKIVVERVPPGAVVRLYLNSDAHPDYRKNPVYAVTPNARNVVVEIREKTGHATETDVPVQIINPNSATEAAKPADTYSAKLTGITWMKISHKYDLSEVNALLPTGTSQLVIDAVRSIYAGLTVPQIILVLDETPERRVTINFDGGNNPVANIAIGYNFLTEGIKRVHPAAFAAFFNAAIASGVSSILINSAWRPMLGSIAHRAGLGIDVSIIGSTVVNRDRLKLGTGSSLNVTAAEKELFRTYQTTQTAAAKSAWNAERNQNEPAAIKRFRTSLAGCRSVKQILDPWFTDIDNLDNVPSSNPNEQKNANEKGHDDHLHVTIHEPKIRGS